MSMPAAKISNQVPIRHQFKLRKLPVWGVPLSEGEHDFEWPTLQDLQGLGGLEPKL